MQRIDHLIDVAGGDTPLIGPEAPADWALYGPAVTSVVPPQGNPDARS